MADQWIFDKDFSFDDENFAKIYRFFTIETPVENTSKREKSLESYGWNKNRIIYVLKRELPTLNKNWKTVAVKDIEEDILNFCRQNKKEIFIHTNSKNNKSMSLFYAIRCAFAHGAFNKTEYYGEQFYFFENRNNGKLKGRIVAKETTLLRIIEIIENPNKYQASSKKKGKNRK